MNNATKTETTRTVAFTGTAFGGARERLSVALDADGGVRVFDEIAGHYTRAHALSEQDIAAARLAPCEHYWSCGCGCTRDSGPIR